MTTRGTGVRTDTETMAGVAMAVEGVADELTADLTALVNRLSAVDWQGLGGQSFTATGEAVQEQMARLHVALRSIAEGVRTSGVSYAVTDDEMRRDLEAVGANESTITAALNANPGD